MATTFGRQLGLFGSAPAARTPAPPTFARVTTRTDCTDCYRDQDAAAKANQPVPLRQRARVRMTDADGTETLLCTPHACEHGYRGQTGTGRR